MALPVPLWIMPYTASSVIVNPIKITQGGVSAPYATNHALTTSYTGQNTRNRLGFVHRGRPYLFATDGLITFNPRSNLWERVTDGNSYTHQIASVGSYLIVNNRNTGWYRFEDMSDDGTTLVGGGTAVPVTDYDHLIHNGDMFTTSCSVATYNTQRWAYPFTAAPTNTGIALIHRLAGHRGSVYGVGLSTGTSYLYKYTGGTFQLQGTGFSLTDAANVTGLGNYFARTSAFFSFGGTLWLIVGYTGSGASTWKHRCYSVALDGNSVTEDTTVIPASYKTAPGIVYRLTTEVLYDAGAARQVFVCCNDREGAVDVFEFLGAGQEMVLIANTGARTAGTPIIWDPTCKSCDISSVTDSVPSNFATVQHLVSNRYDNGTVDIDIRYKDANDTTGDPPWTACTNKTGQGEGKTALSSKPSSITTAADLSDDFSGVSVNTDRWARVSRWLSWADKDYGARSQMQSSWADIRQIAGNLCISGTAILPSMNAHGGRGLCTRWWLTGDFQADADIELTNLRVGTTGQYTLVFLAHVAYQQVYGIRVWINSSGTVNTCEGFTFSPGAAASVSASVTAFANGTKFRISRAGSTWNMLVDPGGVGEASLLPASTPAWTDDVKLYLLLRSSTAWTTNPATGDPGPGFRGITVTGTLGKYDETYGHDFAWDHVTDLGTGISNNYQLFADTN